MWGVIRNAADNVMDKIDGGDEEYDNEEFVYDDENVEEVTNSGDAIAARDATLQRWKADERRRMAEEIAAHEEVFQSTSAQVGGRVRNRGIA